MEESLVQAKKIYYEYVDREITDIQDFDKFTDYLNEENKHDFIKAKIGSMTPENTPDFDKIKRKIEIKADKIPRVNSIQVVTRTDKAHIVNAKNYSKIKKWAWLAISTIGSVAMSIVLASIAFDKFAFSIASLFRFCTYMASIVMSIMTGMFKGYSVTKSETLDHLSRLTFIIDKYVN